MKKTISPLIRTATALVLALVLIAGYAVLPVFAATDGEEAKAEVPALFYVLNRSQAQYRTNPDPQFYTRLGYGAIAPPDQDRIEDDSAAIEDCIVQYPGLSAADLSEGETIVWYRLQQMANNGQWWIYGEIVSDGTAPDPTDSFQEEAAETAATFYVLKRGNEKYRPSPDPQYYTRIGYGTLKTPSTTLLEDDLEAIADCITDVPSPDAVELKAGETISWYRTKYHSNNGQWWVYGEIVSDGTEPVPEEPAPAEPVETTATFYVLKRGNGKYRPSPDPQYYTSIGYGTLKTPSTTLLEDDLEAIADCITTTPSPDAAELKKGETISWYRTKYHSNNGQWWVYGEIVSDGTEPEPEEPAPVEPAEITATFYVLKRGNEKYRSNSDPQYFTRIGYGTLKTPSTALLEDDLEAIAACITTTPAPDAAELKKGETISWYRTKYHSNNGQWWVYGEIVSDGTEPEPEEPAPVEPAEITATFYVLKRGNEKYRSNSDPQYFTRIGYGTLKTPSTALLEDDLEAIAACITTTPAPDAAGLEEGETISWYRTKYHSNNGQWWVYGEIVPNNIGTIPTEPTPEEPAEATAEFYLLNDADRQYRSSTDLKYYRSLGSGTIKIPSGEVVETEDAVGSYLLKRPDTSAIEAASGPISWYRIKKDGVWRVYGEQPPAVPDPEESADTFRALLCRLLTTGDTKTYNVAKYKITYAELTKVYNDVMSKEARIAAGCYLEHLYSTTASNGIIQTFTLKGVDTGFQARYTKAKATVDFIKGSVDSRMSDMEKLLWAHDYIVSQTTYKRGTSAERSLFIAAGPLAEGYGNCSGLADALILLAQEFGMETRSITSSKMDHGWMMVRLEGEWYHVDPTWDHTRVPQRGYDVGHDFFLRNDSEFRYAKVNQHWGWDENQYLLPPKSTSTAYSSWFGHSVVTRMYYHDGFWYYTWGQSIVRSKIDGTQRETLVKGNGKTVRITAFDQGQFDWA